MSTSDLHSISTIAIATSFSVVGAVWLLGAVYNFFRAPDEQDHVSFLWPAFILFNVASAIASRAPTHIWKPLLVHAGWIRLIGLGLLGCSTIFTLWARMALGTMWTGDPSIKVGHRLQTRGPYAIVRHPIYTGLLGMLAGAVVLGGGGRWFLVVALNIVVVEAKIPFEERLLMSNFPAEYHQYRSRVPKLIPGLKLLTRRGNPHPGQGHSETVPGVLTKEALSSPSSPPRMSAHPITATRPAAART